MAEIAFEYLLGALEAGAAKGTPVDPPTHYLNMAGSITPRVERYRPNEARGLLAEYTRSKLVKQWSEWEGEGPADVYMLPFFLEMAVKGGGVIAIPPGGTLARTHTYMPTLTGDDILSATLYWGDPNVQPLQAPYCMLDELTISADAAAAGPVTMSAKGQGQMPDKVAPASVPEMLEAPLLAATDMQLWLDSTAAIGTTEISGRFLSAEVTIPSGVAYKWGATGPTGDRSFMRHGRKKRHATMKLVFELLDMDQYDLWAGADRLKARLRLNGDVIEDTLRHYIQVDMYGSFDEMDWGELEGANRTIELSIQSEYDATADHDYQVVVQNDLASL